MNPTDRAEGALVENLLSFIDALRRAGLDVSLDQTLRCLRALRLIDLSNRHHFFYATRALLVTRHEDLRLFDTLFHRYWAASTSQPDGNERRPRGSIAPSTHRPFSVATYLAAKARQTDPPIDVIDRSGTFSDLELLHQKDFSRMTSEELAAVRRLLHEMAWPVSERRTRRLVAEASPSKGRALHLHRVLRDVVRYGTPLRLAWRSPKVKPRPIVLIADISGSMEKYARLTLQLFYCLTHRLREVETFVFGTRLSRITTELKLRNVDRALERASHEVLDWAGGTRIGESLYSFNRRWARRVVRRGAVVLIVSDGWERGAVDVLANEMRQLQRRSHRLVWLNPLLGRAAYEPRVEGMAAALPFVDDFLPVHNLQSLQQLAWHLRNLPRRRPARRQRPSVGLSKPSFTGSLASTPTSVTERRTQ